jgi:hypothetical protein
VKTLIAAILVLALPLTTLAGNPFCKVQAVQKVVVQKQVVAYPVHAGYGHYAPQQYYYPAIGQYASYKTPDELTAAALDRLNLTIREAQGLPANALAQTDISGILQKCAKCHGYEKQAANHWTFDPSAPLDASVAAYVGRGLRNGMSEKAKLTDAEQDALFGWYEETMFSHVAGE